MITIQTIFTESAEKLLIGETGLIKFDYEGITPCIGDKLTVKTSPTGKTLTFVCQERHFDFSEAAKPTLTLLFDVCS
jgi:hypothetical protein